MKWTAAMIVTWAGNYMIHCAPCSKTIVTTYAGLETEISLTSTPTAMSWSLGVLQLPLSWSNSKLFCMNSLKSISHNTSKSFSLSFSASSSTPETDTCSSGNTPKFNLFSLKSLSKFKKDQLSINLRSQRKCRSVSMSSLQFSRASHQLQTKASQAIYLPQPRSTISVKTPLASLVRVVQKLKFTLKTRAFETLIITILLKKLISAQALGGLSMEIQADSVIWMESPHSDSDALNGIRFITNSSPSSTWLTSMNLILNS